LEPRGLQADSRKGKTMKKYIALYCLCTSFITPVLGCGPQRCESYFFNKPWGYANLELTGLELDIPFSAFSDRNMGIMRPGMSVLYLLAAYREWGGRPLSRDEYARLEQAAHRYLYNEKPFNDILEGRRVSSTPMEQAIENAENAPTGYETWHKAASKVPGSKVPRFISTSKSIVSSKDGIETYRYFENCTNDAFSKAASTLNAMVDSYGVSHPGVLRWVLNQNRVYENCGDENKEIILPNALPESASHEEIHHYNYQVASSYFYALNFSKSAQLFEAIARDPEAPDQALAAYLVVRAHYRSIIVQKGQAAPFFEAVKTFSARIGKSAYAEELQKLIMHVKVIENPAKALLELSHALEGQRGALVAQQLNDLVYLYKTREDLFKGADFIDWLQTYRDPKGFERAYKTWQEKKTLAWLIAALEIIPASASLPSDLLEAARLVSINSKAHLTVRFLLARYYAKQSPQDSLNIINEVLKSTQPQSAHNRFLDLRTQVADSFETFYESVLQRPLMNTCMYEPKVSLDFSEESSKTMHQLPTSRLKEIMHHKNTPHWFKRQTQSVLFVRSLLLGKTQEAEQHLKELSQNNQAFKFLYESLRMENNSERKTLLMHLALLRFPGLTLLPYPSYWRDSENDHPDVIDRESGFRQNWWHDAEMSVAYKAPRFLDKQEQEKAKAEWEQLQSVLRNGLTDYMCQKTLRWAESMPGEALLPELMHLCVRLSRFDTVAPLSSLQVFKVLHGRYKNTEFSKMTPYHYYFKAQ
jgi:hypothetical protein